nr:hypothetical protein [Candidatus Sigynarchaeota archaeon]
MQKVKPGDLVGSLKEAAGLLDYLKIDEGKLEEIFDQLTEKIKDNPTMNDLVNKLATDDQGESQSVDFPRFFKLLSDEKNIPLIEQLFAELGNKPEIIENIEKKILPILFSK